MALARLIYASNKAEDVEMPDILRILDTASKNNKRHGITGLLCFTENMFMQVIEGDSFLINQLYRNIVVDKRHAEVNLIDYAFIWQREFPDWAMGFVDMEKMSTKGLDICARQKIPLKNLDPYLLDATRAMWMLKELSKTLHR